MNLKWFPPTEKATLFLSEDYVIQISILATPGHFFSQSNSSQENEDEQVAQLQEEKVYQSRGDRDLGDVDQDEEAQFQMLMDKLGAQKVLEE